jgi:hypothetical protein
VSAPACLAVAALASSALAGCTSRSASTESVGGEIDAQMAVPGRTLGARDLHRVATFLAASKGVAG